ncbi:MAG: AsmA family protein [Pseudomonadales bacterium]
MEHPVRIGGWLRITMLVLLAIMGAAALLLTYITLNPNALKPVAGYLTERLLGRTLIIDGDITLDLSLKPRASISNARFANASSSTHPYMASAGYVLAQIDLPELLNRRVRLLELDVREGFLLLENPVAEPPNWAFRHVEDGAQEADEAAGSGWSFILEGLDVEDSTLRLELGEIEPIEIRIPRLVESTDAAGYLTLDGEGSFNGQRWQAKGRLGRFDELLAAGHVDLTMDLDVEQIELSVAGSIGNLARLTPLELSVRLHGPDASLFGALFRMPEAFAGDVALEASIVPTGDRHRLTIDGNIAQFSVDANGTVRDLFQFDGLDASVDIRGPDAGVIAKALQISTLPGGPFEISGALHRDGGDLDLTDVRARLSAADLALSADFANFPDTSGARVNATLTGDDLGAYRQFLRLPAIPDGLPFEIDLALDAATDALTSSVRVGDHTLNATGAVGAFPYFDGSRLALDASGRDVTELARFLGQEVPLSGPYHAAATLALADGGLTATGARLEIDPLTFAGTIRIADLDQPRRLSVDGSLDADDLSQFRKWLSREDLPPGPLSMTIAVSSDGSTWQLEQARGRLARLDFDVSGKLGSLTTLRGIDLTAGIHGPDINVLFDHALPDASEIPFSLTSRILGADGAMDLQGFELTTQGGVLKADSRISLAQDFVGSRLSISGEGANLAHLIPDFPQYRPSQQPWKLDGTYGIPSPGHVEIGDSSLQVGSVRIAASGVVDVRDQQRTNLSLAISGNAIDDVGQLGGLDWPAIPFSVSTELDGSPDAINISRLDATWGDSDLKATGSIDIAGKPHLVLKGNSSLLSIVEIQQAIPDAAGETATTGPARLIPDTPIPLDLLERQDLDLSIEVGRFEGRRTSLNDVDLIITLRDGVLQLERVRYRDEYGFFDATGTVEPTAENGVARLTLSVKGEDADLGLFTSPDQPKETRPSYNLDIAITGTGRTAAELAGNLDGTVLIHSDGGRISNTLIQTYASDFMVNVLETLNPFTKSEPYTQVQCMVLNTAITDGRINLQPGFVMRTNRLNMFVGGDVDLKTERLNLSLATQARQGIGISAATLTNPYFKVGGTLSSPQLQLDAQSAAISASVTAATAGLSIVVRGVWSRLMGEQNPCPQFLNYQRKTSKKADKK